MSILQVDDQSFVLTKQKLFLFPGNRSQDIFRSVDQILNAYDQRQSKYGGGYDTCIQTSVNFSYYIPLFPL